MEYVPIVASRLALPVYSTYRVWPQKGLSCSKERCSLAKLGALLEFQGEDHSSSYRGGAVTPLGPVSGLSSSGGGEIFLLLISGPQVQGIKKLISSFPLLPVSYQGRVLKPIPFSA